MILWSRKGRLRKELKENSGRSSTKTRKIIQRTEEENIPQEIEVRSIERRDITGMCQILIITTPLTSICIQLSKKNGTKSLAGYVGRMGILPQGAHEWEESKLNRGKKTVVYAKKAKQFKKENRGPIVCLKCGSATHVTERCPNFTIRDTTK